MRQSIIQTATVVIGIAIMLILVTSCMRQSASTGGNQSGTLTAKAPTEVEVAFDPLATLPPSAYLGNPLMADDSVYDQGVTAIYTAQEAISLTLTQLPSGFAPIQIKARLVTAVTLGEQFLGVLSEDARTGVGPIWLVGVIGDGLTNADILRLPASVIGSPQSISGAYFAWDANSSLEYARGLLSSTGETSMATILSLVDAPLAIATSTEFPYLGEVKSTPPTP